MKIAVIGGSQGTGARLAALAAHAGHEVTALSRSGTAPAGVRAIAGDAADPAVVQDAIAGADAVVVTVGGAKGVTRHRAVVTASVIQAMERAGVHRLVVQSSVGAGDSGVLMPVPLRLLMKAALAGPLADHTEQEAAVRRSSLRWTIVRPTGLTDRAGTGSWQALEVGEPGKLGGSIPRDDVAAYLLRVLGDDTLIGAAVGISS
ncbi:NAD(P)-dependent oxidoreductase [Microbacterium terrisoli]|uniref:NAD(P)-dependent oxidoreductase n=1 Tax=Microbacterium terrisoli TaxID=3242192 RepID=UPI002803BBB2|nr:SDR family oxidoreductase [Microbacterium protaetiae]